MAVNVQVYDLTNYPDNNKTVTIDIKQVTPIGYEGDEQWVISATTTAYSDIAARTAIQDIYLTDIKGGWVKSSGFKSEPFTISAAETENTLLIRIDNDVPTETGISDLYDVGGSTYWWMIVMDDGVYTGDDLAEHIEEKIRDLVTDNEDTGDPFNVDDPGSSAGHRLAYMNASVEFANGKFRIISGTVSDSYTDNDRSSVLMYTGSFTNSANSVLGFDLPLDTYNLYLALADMVESATTSAYTSPATDLAVNFPTGTATTSGVFFIRDNVDNTKEEYFLAITGSDENTLKVTTPAGAQLANSYDEGSRVQLLSWNDVSAEPNTYYQEVDSAVRWTIKTLANQIDYSS